VLFHLTADHPPTQVQTPAHPPTFFPTHVPVHLPTYLPSHTIHHHHRAPPIQNEEDGDPQQQAQAPHPPRSAIAAAVAAAQQSPEQAAAAVSAAVSERTAGQEGAARGWGNAADSAQPQPTTLSSVSEQPTATAADKPLAMKIVGVDVQLPQRLLRAGCTGSLLHDVERRKPEPEACNPPSSARASGTAVRPEAHASGGARATSCSDGGDGADGETPGCAWGGLASADRLATPYTNYTSGYQALLDYVWYQPHRLQVRDTDRLRSGPSWVTMLIIANFNVRNNNSVFAVVF
jgi:hypothetical protein